MAPSPPSAQQGAQGIRRAQAANTDAAPCDASRIFDI
jgi:hypothetical protein